jgi:hypothetical protein
MKPRRGIILFRMDQEERESDVISILGRLSDMNKLFFMQYLTLSLIITLHVWRFHSLYSSFFLTPIWNYDLCVCMLTQYSHHA